jgi:anthranilate phosphoribosyltransferase
MDPLDRFLKKVQTGQSLDELESEQAIEALLKSAVEEPEKVKAFLLAMRQKGETLSEVVGAAKALRARALTVSSHWPVVVDTCGTGGDGLHTFNISTCAALVVAAAGLPVAKHGNRSVSSLCGSADLLEALGVRVDVEPSVVERCLQEVRFGFLFAPRFHPAMAVLAPIRKALGVATLFNLLGPLTNPAGVRHQVVGVADASKMELYARALLQLGAVRCMVVHGGDGQDELSTTAANEVIEFDTRTHDDRLAQYRLDPEAFGIRKARLDDLRGGGKEENANLALRVLNGEHGPLRDAVLLNAAAALYIGGMAGDLDTGWALAREALDRGKAMALLERLKDLTHGLAG